MAASETAKLIAELGFNDKLTPGVNKALGSVGRLDKGLGRVGKGVGQLGVGMARAGVLIGTAAVAGLGAAAKAAIDWEDAFAGVVKTVDEADLAKAGLSFRDLELSLRKMSTTMPIAAADLAAIAEAGGAMGIAGKDIEEFTRVVALIGSTTNVSTEEAATALGQLSNVLGITADDFDNFASSLVDLGNKGASTEDVILQITTRAGAGAKLIGIAAGETLGWSAAVANLGIEAEAGGSALQKFFLGSLKNVAEGGAELSVMAKTAGLTGKAFKKAFDKDASGALAKFLGGLGKLDQAAQLNVLKTLGFSDIRITRLLLGLAGNQDNLTNSLNTGTEAWEANTAAQIEFDKRNATVRSGITRLKNSLTDAAITLGEGFAPALGRSAGKLAEFLAQDENRNALKAIGEDIGKSIDAIDWKQVLEGARTFVTVMKSALSFAKLLLDAVMSLPTEVKAAGLALIGLNKLSGGLVGAGIGSVVGGLGESLAKSLASRIPVFGKAFVQPVFVTNMGAGGLGGGGKGGVPAAAAGGGLAGALGAVAVPALAVVAVAGAAKLIQDNIDKQGVALIEQAQKFAPKATDAELARSIDGLRKQVESMPFNTFDSKNKVVATLNTLIAEQNRRNTPETPMNPRSSTPDYRDWKSTVRAGNAKIVTAVENMRADLGKDLSKVPVKLDKVATNTVAAGVAAKNAGDKNSAASRAAGITAALASKNAGIVSRSGGLAAAAAIRGKKMSVTNRITVPVTTNVSVRNVVQAYYKVGRYGHVAEFG